MATGSRCRVQPDAAAASTTAVAAPTATGRPSWCTKKRVLAGVYYAHLLLITLAMAVLDFDDPLVLGLGVVVGNAMVVWRTYTAFESPALAIAAQALALFVFGTMAFIIYKVNQTERYCKLYKEIGQELEARGPDALGHPSRRLCCLVGVVRRHV